MPGPPWDLAALQQLAEQANEATLAVLDLCAADEASRVTVPDVMAHAGITNGQVKGQLAGLTMRIKNPKYGFARTTWPFEVGWQPGGVALYRLPADLVPLWRQARGLDQAAPADQSQNSLPALPNELE